VAVLGCFPAADRAEDSAGRWDLGWVRRLEWDLDPEAVHRAVFQAGFPEAGRQCLLAETPDPPELRQGPGPQQTPHRLRARSSGARVRQWAQEDLEEWGEGRDAPCRG
jgi:hypothetical protein